jgi:hypothetical protein
MGIRWVAARLAQGLVRVGLLGALGCGGGGSDAPPLPTAEQLVEIAVAVDAAKGPDEARLGAPRSKFGLLDSPTTLYREDGTQLRMYTKPRAPVSLFGKRFAITLGFDRREVLRRIEYRSRDLDRKGCIEAGYELGLAYGLPSPEADGSQVWRGEKVYVRWSFADELREKTCLITWDLVVP